MKFVQKNVLFNSIQKQTFDDWQKIFPHRNKSRKGILVSLLKT